MIAGAKYYFGGSGKTLKQKHREDDPPNSALNGLSLCAQGNCFEEEKTFGRPDDIKDDIETDDVVTP